MDQPQIIHPSQAEVAEAHRIAESLEAIATQAGAFAVDHYGPQRTPLSQSDRLVIIAARLGRITALLATRWVDPNPPVYLCREGGIVEPVEPQP